MSKNISISSSSLNVQYATNHSVVYNNCSFPCVTHSRGCCIKNAEEDRDLTTNSDVADLAISGFS